MTPKFKKIILIVVLVGALFLVYSMFFKKSNTPEELISGTNSLSSQRTSSETKILGEQITNALLQIESLNLDRSIFDSEILNSLVDRSEPIIPEPIGRKNPFASLSDTSVNYNSGVASYNSGPNNVGIDISEDVEKLPTFATSSPSGKSSTTPRTLPAAGL